MAPIPLNQSLRLWSRGALSTEEAMTRILHNLIKLQRALDALNITMFEVCFDYHGSIIPSVATLPLPSHLLAKEREKFTINQSFIGTSSPLRKINKASNSRRGDTESAGWFSRCSNSNRCAEKSWRSSSGDTAKGGPPSLSQIGNRRAM